MSFNDDKFDLLFPTRTGNPIGTANERKMLDAVGGSDGFRTRVDNSVAGQTTIMRTKNGQPQFTTTNKSDSVTKTATTEQLCAVKVPAYSDAYTLATADVTYVSMNKNGGEQNTYSRDDYYRTRAFASKWTGVGSQEGKVVVANASRDGSRWQGVGPISPDTRLGNPPFQLWAGTLYPYNTGIGSIFSSVTGAESTKWGASLVKPPGSPLRWFAWDQVASLPHTFPTAIFSDGYALTYGDMSAVKKQTAAHIDAAFFQWDAGDNVSDLCYIQCMPDAVSTSGIPQIESVFGKLINVSKGTVANITYDSVPAKGFAVEQTGTTISMQTFSNSNWYIPLTVNGEGTRALCLNNAFYRRNSNGYTTGAVAALDIDLVMKRARVFEVDSYYLNTISNVTPSKLCDLLDFGFVDTNDGEKAAILCIHYALPEGQYALLQRGIFLGQKSLVEISAPDSAVEIECVYSDISADLFIVAIKRTTSVYPSPQEVHAAFIVIYKHVAVKTFYVTQIVHGDTFTQQYYENSIVETNSASGTFLVDSGSSLPLTGNTVPLHTHYTFTDAGLQTWEGPFGGRSCTYTASASVDKSESRIAVSIVLSSPNANIVQNSSHAPRHTGAVRADFRTPDDVCVGPAVINAIIDTASGIATNFGSDEHYYNRLHYQEV